MHIKVLLVWYWGGSVYPQCLRTGIWAGLVLWNMLYWPHLVSWAVFIAGQALYVWRSSLYRWLTDIVLEPWREFLKKNVFTDITRSDSDRRCLCWNVAGICASTSLCLSVRKDRHKAYTSEGRWCHCYINVRAVCQWESVSLARPSRLTHRVSGSRRSARSTRRKAMYVCIRQTDQISRTIQTGIFNWR